MSKRPESLFDKWINGRFDSKIVVSVTQKDQYKNLGFSVINGREYSTKLGNAISVQLGPKDLQELRFNHSFLTCCHPHEDIFPSSCLKF
ncbi:MAG: hypothetical protein ACW964_20435 [Candidatus Hodarchaeales archaeon]